MTKQAFEDQIIDLIDDTTVAKATITDEGTIGVGVTFNEEAVRTEANRLYDEMVATEPDAEPEQPVEPSAAFSLQLDFDDQQAQSTQPFTTHVYLTAHDQDRAHLIVDVEAWQNGRKIQQAFVARQVLSRNQTAIIPVTLPRLAAGVYQLKAFVFEGAKDGTYEWGKKLYANEDAGTFTVTAAQPYVSTKPNNAGYARLEQQVDQYVSQYPELKTIANEPTGIWLGDWTGDVAEATQKMAAQANGQPLLLVVYNIPNRDTGEYSAGGKASPEEYHIWIDALAKGVGEAPACYVLEPDAIGHLSRMTADQKKVRLELLQYAITTLGANAKAQVFIDASMWVKPAVMAEHLKELAGLDGFTVNVSGYKKLAVCKTYADELKKLTKLNYLIDTSRNGIGTDADDGRWCNVPGQALGEAPDLQKGFAWIKAPGESDGLENGGPAAGEFWLEGALALVKNAKR